MILKKIQVTHFRSVEDSEEFEVDDQITCLVGKNEAGKTALLQAIATLNPHDATPMVLQKERDYPRRLLTQYDELHPDEEAVVTKAVWKLNEDEKAKVEAEFGEGTVTGDNLTTERAYNRSGSWWTIPVSEAKAIQNLISAAKLSAPEKSQLHSPRTTRDLRNAISSLGAKASVKHQQILNQIDSYPNQSVLGGIRAILEPTFPKFMYFSNYDRMSGQVRLERLQGQEADGSLFEDYELRGDRLFYEFLEFAGTSVDEILEADTYELFSAKLQAASNNITDQILDYWSQNPYIEVNVAVDTGKSGDPPPYNEGVVGRARIRNQLHRVDVPFSERSAGFIWFFSFLVKFAQVQDDKTPIILLLDEPGLTLHGKAQADLLRYFDDKLSAHQIIYTTHSPFMVPADKLTRSRIVEDIVDSTKPNRPIPIGTKVREDVLNRDPDTIFPLQGALGYEITQTLFVGKNTLIVEGPSDILFLKAFSAALIRRSRTGLDPRWTLCPSGGIGKVMPFVSLFKGNNLKVGVLVDYARGNKRKIEALRQSELLSSGAVLTIERYAGKSEGDTEDIFDIEIYTKLLNVSFGLDENDCLSVDKLDNADTATERLVKKAEAYFKVLPPDAPHFDHFTPALWLIENIGFLSGNDSGILETLDRAETLINDLNKLLD